MLHLLLPISLPGVPQGEVAGVGLFLSSLISAGHTSTLKTDGDRSQEEPAAQPQWTHCLLVLPEAESVGLVADPEQMTPGRGLFL